MSEFELVGQICRADVVHPGAGQPLQCYPICRVGKILNLNVSGSVYVIRGKPMGWRWSKAEHLTRVNTYLGYHKRVPQRVIGRELITNLPEGIVRELTRIVLGMSALNEGGEHHGLALPSITGPHPPNFASQ